MQLSKVDLINALNGQAFDEKTAKKADIIETLESVFSVAEGMAKVKTANEEISKERESLKAEKAALKTQITELETKVKTMSNTAGSGSQVAELEAQINRMKTDFDALKGETIKERDARIAAETTVKKEKLRSLVITEATAHKARKPDKLIVLMESDGLIGTDEKGEPVFYRMNAGRKEAASAPEAVKAYLDANPGDVEPSGNAGSGSSHAGGVTDKPFDRVAALGKGSK